MSSPSSSLASPSFQQQHFRASLLHLSDSIEVASAELFDVAVASLLVGEAFARQLLQLQQGKESDYIRYIVGQADKPSGTGCLPEQMPQLETVLLTGAGYLVEAGEANVGVAMEKLLSLRRIAHAAARHIAGEEARSAAAVTLALQEQQRRFHLEKEDLMRRMAQAEDAVAAACTATAVIAPIRAIVRTAAVQTSEGNDEAMVAADEDFLAIPIHSTSSPHQHETHNSHQRSDEQKRRSASSAAASAARQEEHDDAFAHHDGPTTARATESSSSLFSAAARAQPEQQEKQPSLKKNNNNNHSNNRHHFDAAASLSTIPLVRADAWLKSPTKWNANGRSVSLSASPPHSYPQTSGAGNNANSAASYNSNYRSASYNHIGSSNRQFFYSASPDIMAAVHLFDDSSSNNARSLSAAVAGGAALSSAVTRWAPHTPSRSQSATDLFPQYHSHHHGEQEVDYDSNNNNNNNTDDQNASLTEEQRAKRAERRNKIISVVESERFEAKDIDWGRSLAGVVDPYRYEEKKAVWDQPWRRYEEKQRERQAAFLRESEELLKKQQEEQSQEDDNDVTAQQQPSRQVMSASSSTSARDVDSPVPTTVPNTSRAVAGAAPAAATAAIVDVVADNATTLPQGFVHPADLLALRAKDAEAAAAALYSSTAGAADSHQNHPHHHATTATNKNSTPYSHYADSYGALGSMRAGEAQAIVAVASGTATEQSYAVDTTLQWLMRTAHGPMLGLEQSLLQRDFAEKSAGRSISAFERDRQREAAEKKRQEDSDLLLKQKQDEEEKKRLLLQQEREEEEEVKRRTASATPISPSKSIGGKKVPGAAAAAGGGKPPIAVKAPAVVATKGGGKLVTTTPSSPASSGMMAKKMPAATGTAAAAAAGGKVATAIVGRARAKTFAMTNNNSIASLPESAASSSLHRQQQLQPATDRSVSKTSADMLPAGDSIDKSTPAAGSEHHLSAAALSQLIRVAGQADPVSEFQRQLQTAGAFVGIDEEQRRQEEGRLRQSQMELIRAAGGASGGQIIEDEDEIMEALERNSDYNPAASATGNNSRLDASLTHRSQEAESLKQLHHLLGGVQASMTRDPGAPPLDPEQIEETNPRLFNPDGSPTKLMMMQGGGSDHQGGTAAAAGVGQQSAAAAGGVGGVPLVGGGVLHALHRVLKEETRGREAAQQKQQQMQKQQQYSGLASTKKP